MTRPRQEMTSGERRRFLRLATWAGLSLFAGGRRAEAVGEKTKLTLGRLDVPAGGEHEGALERLAWELNLRTSVESSFEINRPKPDSKELFDSPFLYFGGSTSFPELSEEAIRNLRRYLDFGGFLLVDDTSGYSGSPFDESARRLIARIYPETPLERLPDDHSIFRSYYLIRRVTGRVSVSPFLEGCTVEDRSPLVFCRNDLSGAWARDSYGRWLFDCAPGGERQRQQAFGLGVNAVLYALTVNYKQDQIHLPFILQRMRR